MLSQFFQHIIYSNFYPFEYMFFNLLFHYLFFNLPFHYLFFNLLFQYTFFNLLFQYMFFNLLFQHEYYNLPFQHEYYNLLCYQVPLSQFTSDSVFVPRRCKSYSSSNGY